MGFKELENQETNRIKMHLHKTILRYDKNSKQHKVLLLICKISGKNEDDLSFFRLNLVVDLIFFPSQ